MAMRDNAAMHSQYPNQTTSTMRAGQSMRTRRHMGAFRIALFVLLGLMAGSGLQAQTGTVTPSPKFYATDNSGAACNGCQLFTYSAGTLTPLATYADSTLATPNANPVVLDSAGRATIYLTATSYKFILKTGAGVTLWTVDNVASVGLSVAAIGSELVSLLGDPNVAVTATSYPSGTTYDKLHAGSLMFSFNSANLVGTYALEGMVMGNGGTISVGLVNLSDGSPDTALVTITSSNATGERQVSSTITFAGTGAAKVYGVKGKVTAGYGRAWGLRLVRIS